MKITELFIYPLKSAAAQKVGRLEITEQGPSGDRQWLLVDESGKFLTQRTLPKMAQVVALHEAGSLTLGLGKMFLKLSTQKNSDRRIAVQVWDSKTEAILAPDLYSQALSQFLNVPCKLVEHVSPVSKRPLNSETPNWNPEVRFADSRPLLIVNTKSLEDLNSKLEHPVPVNRFRANIVFEGEQAFQEDAWKKIKIGEVVFSQPKPCTRCKIINIDQTTGLSSADAQPLKALSEYRRQQKGVAFGVLWIPEGSGAISSQDSVQVLA